MERETASRVMRVSNGYIADITYESGKPSEAYCFVGLDKGIKAAAAKVGELLTADLAEKRLQAEQAKKARKAQAEQAKKAQAEILQLPKGK